MDSSDSIQPTNQPTNKGISRAPLSFILPPTTPCSVAPFTFQLQPLRSALLSLDSHSTLPCSAQPPLPPACAAMSASSSLASSTAAASSSASSSSPASSLIRHVLVVGGTGFVGGAVCRSALRHGLVVTSLSRTGCSPYEGSRVRDERHTEWTRRVRWRRGDVLDRSDQQWAKQLLPSAAPTASATAAADSAALAVPPVDAVVSCVGGFGSVAHMRRVNGDANIAVFEAASACQSVRRVGFVSAFHYQLPGVLQRGYMEGKLAAEASLASLLGGTREGRERAAVVSQTGFLYGSRYLRSLGVHLPLQLLGAPLGLLTDNAVVAAIRHSVLGPLLTPALLPPVSVDALSDLLIERLMDPKLAPGVHTVTVEEIRQAQRTKAD